jgi:tetratricopeptide (TPR) repeat protein
MKSCAECAAPAGALRALGEANAGLPDLDSKGNLLPLQKLYQQALDHQKRGRHADAVAGYDEVIALQSDHAPAYCNRGAALAALNRNDEALASFDRAVALRPNDATMLNNRGMALGKLGRHREALESLNHAIELAPDNASAHHNRGIALAELGNHDEALRDFDRAVELAPDFVHAHHSRGMTLAKLGRLDEAVASYDRGIALAPNLTKADHERGKVLTALGRYGQALESIDRAIALDPLASALQLAKGMALLRLGDYENGLELYEWRWRGGAPVEVRQFTQPQWRGEAITDRTILLHAEQGLGDSMQMLRYLPMVKAKAAQVILDMPGQLHPLLGRMADGIVLSEPGRPSTRFDVHCGLMSLPLAFGTRLDTIPARVPYLTVPPERMARWSTRLPRSAYRVGLVWSGGVANPNNHARSIALDRFAPLLQVPGVTFVSLQREYREHDLAGLSRLPVERIDEAIADFGDTAAAIAQCDLVISVDTSVAHLAGALGKPVWLLLAFVPDWRWLLDRTDSPWYPTARLFRQDKIGDWDGVIAQVAEALSSLRQTVTSL